MAPTANHNFAAPAASGASAQDNQLGSKFVPTAHGQANYKNLFAGGLARGVVFGLFALAATPFILAAPAYADDSNTVSISVDPAARLTQQGKLYKATTNVTVKTSKPYGFNLTMQAATADLLNGKDQTHKISAPQSANSVALGSNQWGYALDKSATTFNAVPVVKSGANSVAPAVIADVTKSKPAGCTDPANCTKPVTFAANIDVTKLASGNYSTSITYTATASPKSGQVVEDSTCQSGNPENDCQVDLDPNMIPVKYIGTITYERWTSVAKPENSRHKGDWYDYAKKQWANAVTVKDVSKYKGRNRVIDKSDILGFWVYIPRYAYEVQRKEGSDKPVPAQNFLIHFEKNTDPKRVPASCDIADQDYRTECDLDRDYIKGQPSDNSTWATHPAFTFGTKELNGIWFGKFETTGSISNPTVLPSQYHINSNSIGVYYSVAKSLGVNDPQNVGGDSVSTTQNSHNLAKFSSHMVNNSDWGAATYLSTSKYGAGYNGVHINTSYNSSVYNYDYNTYEGQLTGTTNNIYGIYDMSGGGWEFVAASYSDNLNNSDTSKHFGYSVAHPPYVNTYNFSSFDICTYQTCGGQALHETNNGSQWNNQGTNFVDSSFHWFIRGGNGDDGANAGLFYTGRGRGSCDDGGLYNDAFRVALAPTAQD